MYINNIEGLMDPVDLNWLYLKATEMNNIVEVGSLNGRSACALLNGCKGIVHCIDTFKIPGTYEAFIKNVGHFKNLDTHISDSVKAANKFKNESIDMVFIDADHSYKAVKADIEAWLPKTRKLICGHDYVPSWPGVRKAVDEKFNKINQAHNIWFYKIK